MDFIEGLPSSKGYNVLWVVVDRFTKYAHFVPLIHPYTALTLAQFFMKYIFKVHGMSSSIILDRDKSFTSKFFGELFRFHGVQLHYSTTYHPQSNSQSEAVNKTLENYLRCFLMDRPKDWST